MSMRDNIPGRKNYAPDKRCHWFDNNGRPLKRLDGGLGCPRRDRCFFAHPTEIEVWRNARPGGDPPLHHLTDDEYRLIVGRHRSPGAPRGYPPPPPRPRSISPGRRRSPPRRHSVEREAPPLVSRIRGRSASREREARRLGPRNERSRSPVRPRMHRTTPPPPRGPRMSIGGMPPEGPRGAMGTPRSPIVFPKTEPDVAMKDVTRQAYAREDSVANSHHHLQQDTPTRPPPGSAGPAMISARRQVPPASSTSVSAPAPSTSAPAQPDAIKDLLESSALQWQQISSAVAAASSVTPAKPKMTPPTGTPGETPSEDRAKIWSNRIELLASATRIHNECRSMENDVRDYKQLVESFSYQSLPAEDRTVIEGHLHTLQAQLADKSEELKRILTQLANAKFWLTYSDKSRTSSSREGSQEVTKEVQGLKASVSLLQNLFQTVATRWDQVGKSLQGNRLSGIGNHSINIPGSSPGVGQSNALIAEAIMPKELDKIRNAITSFEDRLTSLENKAAHGSDFTPEEFDAIIAENVQALMLAATGAVQAAPPPPRPANALTAGQLKMLETLQQNAAVTAQQVQQLSQKVTEMAAENEHLQGGNMQLQAENAQLRQQLEESMVVQLPSGGDSAKLDQMQTEMRALNAAVVAYLAQRPSTTPSLPTADALTEQIVPQIITSLPKLLGSELRDQLQEVLRSQQAEFLKELSSKMSTTLQQSVEALRGSMGQMHDPANAEPSVSSSSVNGVDGDASSGEA
ncbi:hypothetical protein OH77DRAFT_1586044 [Trametes cingulata]|nr:hypothetical protein OH77DRAFT_1586044 [Trametes cingulata]